MAELDPKLRAALEALEQQLAAAQQPMGQQQRAPLHMLEAQARRTEIPQQMAQESSPLQAATYQFGGNMMNRGLGLQNSLLSAVNAVVPDLGVFAPHGGMVDERFRAGIQDRMAQNREQFAENEELLAALQEEHPKASFGGDALSFAAELAAARLIGGKAFQGSTKGRTLAGRTAQEAGIGAAFGASAVGMSDADKEQLIAHSLVIGALSPAAFSGASRLFTLKPETIKRITQLADHEKMFGSTGLLTWGELVGHRAWLKIEAAMDNVPVLGLAGKRDRQRKRFVEITNSIVDAMGLRRRGDTPESLVAAVQRRFNRLKQQSDDAYDAIAERIDNETFGGRIKMTLRNMNGREGEYVRTARKFLRRELEIDEAWQNKALIRQLETIIGDSARPKRLTFQGARDTLKAMQENVREIRESANKPKGSYARLRMATQLEQALIADMNAFAKAIAPAGSASTLMQDIKAANDQWRDAVLPFRRAPVVKDVVSGEFDMNLDIDSIVGAFINPAKPGRSAYMLRKMVDPADRDIARFLALREAFDRAGVGSIEVHPEVFRAELKKMSSLMGASWTPDQRKVLEGYMTLVEVGKRAFVEPGAIGAMFGLGSAAAVTASGKRGGVGPLEYIGGLLTARFVLGTKAGTSVLRALADAQSDKQKLQAMKQLEIGMTRWLEANYPEIYRTAFPDKAPKGPYENMNPFTDPFLQRHPPRQDLVQEGRQRQEAQQIPSPTGIWPR